MKILHVVRQYAPAVGGLEAYVQNMARYQIERGADVSVLTLNVVFHGEDNLPQQEIIDGVKVRRVAFKGMRRFFIPLISPRYFKEFDIVHVHNTDVFFDYVALASLFNKQKNIFVTTHGGFFHTQNFSSIKKLYFNIITRLACARYKCVFAISENDYNIFKPIAPRIKLLPNAIKPLGEAISSGDDFMYIGRLAQHKHVERVIKVFAALKNQHGNKGKLHIIGPEWDVKIDDLEHIAAQSDVKNDVVFHGFISPEDMEKVLKQCGYFLSASTFEGFGMSMLEAMSVGLIPFVQPNESFKSLIAQGKVGQCVDFENKQQAAKEIAESIVLLNQNDRQAAQSFSKLFSWEKLIDKTMQTYKECMSK